MADQLFTKSVDSVEFDKLVAGDNVPIQVKGVTIASGQGALVRGTVLGKILLAAGAAVAGANTGNGTVTGISLGKKAKIGTYTLKCVSAAVNSGTFSVVGPDGERYADATVGIAYTGGPLNFTINDGATDFIVGDSFTIPVAAGSEKHVKVNSANADGSEAADCILTDAVDATSADVVTTAYISGLFNRNALVFGGTDDAADHEETLRDKGIILKANIAY